MVLDQKDGARPARNTHKPAIMTLNRGSFSICLSKGIVPALVATLLGVMGISGFGDVGDGRRNHNHLGYARNCCIANLKQIGGAKRTWMLEMNKTTNDVPTDAELFGETGYIRVKPTCIKGGVYTVGRAGENPKCSVKGHALETVEGPGC
jgi:hypothetical protein